MNELDLFAAAIAIPDPVARDALLERECTGNPQQRERLRLLLDAHFQSQSPLDLPAGNRTSPHIAATEDFAGNIEAVGTVIAGRYKLLQRIGEGGMGSVWMADQTEPVKRRVAVKLIRVDRGQSRTILSRFEAERQAIALMDHPHIAKLLDAGSTAEGAPFFVMELVKGIPLNDYCDTHKLSIPERLQLFMQICSAVQHAHQKGIIHRDLKPSNILVESHDGKPVPKVIDFGLAKATTGLKLTEQTLFTGFGSVLGTPLYMAPEQATFNAVDVDTRADIYALGVVLYELLTGTTPLTREAIKQAQLDEMLRLIREQEPPTPSSRLSTSDSKPSVAANRQTEPAKLGRFVKGELDWIVLKPLAKERDRRYESATGFAKDIERFLNHEPVTAGPPTAAYKLRKFVQRHRGQVIAASLVLLALVAGVIGTTIGLLQATAAAERERAANKTAQEEKVRAEQAALAEKAAKERAQRRLAQIDKGVELFARLLKGISPRNEEKGGPTLYQQLRERAVQAAEELDAEAVGDAEEVARLQSILGSTLCELGEYPKAIALLEKSAATFQEKFGSEHPYTVATWTNLAGAYKLAGKLPEAIALLTRLRDVEVRKLGVDQPTTLVTLNNLAVAYQTAGKLPEAIALFEQVRDIQVRKLGVEHSETLTTLNNLALAYRDAGKLPEAIALLEQVRDAQTRYRGADHPITLITLNNLAGMYQNAGKLSKAIEVFEQVRDILLRKLGADHPYTLSALSGLANAYRAANKLPEAISLYEQVRDAQIRKLGAEHPNTLGTQNGLALAYLAVGKLPEAIVLFEQVCNAQFRTLGPEHPETLNTINNLATAYLAAGKVSDAIVRFEQVRKAETRKLGANHPRTLTTLNNLARAYQNGNSLAEALPLFEQAAEGIEKRRFLHEHAHLIIPNTIRAYETANQLERAEAWQRKWLAVVKQQAGTDSPTYAGELASLGKFLAQQKKWAEAESIMRECLSLREKTQPDVWMTFNTQSLLGGALLGQQKYAEAEPLLLAGYAGMKKRETQIPTQYKSCLPEALDRLIELYTAMNKPDEVKKWQAERAKSNMSEKK